MNKRILTTSFYPKIKSNREETKVALMSKLDITERINKSKLDYFGIISKIKVKKKPQTNSELFKNFLLSSNCDKNNVIRYKYLNHNSQKHSALITETYFEKKNLSHKKIKKNQTFSDSFKKEKPTTRKKTNSHGKLINQIIKFEEKKKVFKKTKLIKKRKPKELIDYYKEYVERNKKFNFFNKYPNCDSEYAHNLRVDLYVAKVNESLKEEKKNNDKYLKFEKEKMEEEKELRDKVLYPSLDFQKISKKIKKILTQQSNFNKEKREKFYDKYENRINFLYDNFKPPHIQNNLSKLKFEDIIKDKKLNLINRLGNSAINYLSITKTKLQRERDEKIKFLMEKNKIKVKYNYYKKLSSNNIYNSKEEIEKIIYQNYYLKEDEDIFAPEKNTLGLEEIFEKKNFFEDKFEKFDKVKIAEPKLRKFFFDNLKFNKKNNKILKL